MKNFIATKVEDLASTSSSSAQVRLKLELPGNKSNPQSWLVFASWKLSWAGGNNVTLASAGYAVSGGARSIFSVHKVQGVSATHVESHAGFQLLQDLAGDATVDIEWSKASGSGSSEISNARIVAVRIPKDHDGTLLFNEGSAAQDSPLLSLNVGVAGNGYASAHGNVTKGRYLVLGSVNVLLPTGYGDPKDGYVTASTVLSRAVSDATNTTTGMKDEVVVEIPSELDDPDGPSPLPGLHLIRAYHETVELEHTFFMMGVADLNDEPVSLIVRAAAVNMETASPEELAAVSGAQVALIPLDGNWEYSYAQVPGYITTSSSDEKTILTGADRRIPGAEPKQCIRLGWAAVGHYGNSPESRSALIVRDLEDSPLFDVAETDIQSAGLTAGVAELAFATFTESAGLMSAVVEEESPAVTEDSVVASLMLLTLVDIQSNQVATSVSRSMLYDWDISGAKTRDDDILIEELEEAKRIADLSRPLLSLQDVEVVSESIDKARVAVSDTLTNPPANYGGYSP